MRAPGNEGVAGRIQQSRVPLVTSNMDLLKSYN